MRSGYINVNNGYLGVTNANGYYWSAISIAWRWDNSIMPSAYSLGISANNINPSEGPEVRWDSFPLRC